MNGTSAEADDPALDVTVVRSGLSIPWDLAVLPDGAMLYTERRAKTLTNGADDMILKVTVR